MEANANETCVPLCWGGRLPKAATNRPEAWLGHGALNESTSEDAAERGRLTGPTLDAASRNAVQGRGPYGRLPFRSRFNGKLPRSNAGVEQVCDGW
jgi:hypothetical protein